MKAGNYLNSIAGVTLAIALAFSSFGLGIAAAPAVSVTVCHATGSANNPFIRNNVSLHSVNDAQGLNGHGFHLRDIWAGFWFDGILYPGQGDASRLDSGCNVIEPTPTPTTQPPAPTITPDPTPTDLPPTETPNPSETPTDAPPTETPTDTPPTPTATFDPCPENGDFCLPPPYTATPTTTDPIPSPTATATPPPNTPTQPPPTSSPEPPEPTSTLPPPVLIPLTGMVEGKPQNLAREPGHSTDRLIIPSLGFDSEVGQASRKLGTWELNSELPQALEGTHALAIHAGYSWSPRLAELSRGALILWRDELYISITIELADPSDVALLGLGDLALVTCAGYDGDGWTRRVVVIANRLVNLQ